MALNIVVGITGGIAAYKAVSVVRSLVLAGHDVHVVTLADMLSDQPTRMLDTGADLRTVARCDEREFHRRSNT